MGVSPEGIGSGWEGQGKVMEQSKSSTRNALRASSAPRSRPGATHSSGMSMLEVTIVIVLMTVGMGGFVRVLLSSSGVSTQQFEASVAREAALAKIEEIRSADFDEVLVLYNEIDADDPDGAGTAPGADFAVTGLDPLPGDADGFVGEVVLPSVNGLTIDEGMNLDLLGMPRDLNGDGDSADALVGGDYALLPVTVRIRWRANGKVSSVQATTTLGDFQ